MIYVMRHGKTEWNAMFKMQGRTDIPLNEEGRAMAVKARETYKDIKFDICYCSPLSRARETAEIFLEGTGTEIVFDSRLEEMSFGELEGAQNVFEHPEWNLYKLFNDPANYIADSGAESFEELYARTGSFIEEYLKDEIDSEKNILIIAHGALNCSILNQLKNTPIEDFWKHMHDNCQLLKV